MPSRIFLAGATGAVGKPLLRLLLEAGHTVHAGTRSAGKLAALRAAGATAMQVDVFDAAAIGQAVREARPDIVMHQLTDLPPGLDPALMAEALVRNARLRDEGSRNLVAAAIAAGARRFIAQSIAWVYAEGPQPYKEGDPIAVQPDGTHSVSIAGVLALERQTLNSPPLQGVVLRYGNLYGPGTGRDAATGASPLHVDAAAQAALLAMHQGASGIYNCAEDHAAVSSAKARRELGWSPEFRCTK